MKTPLITITLPRNEWDKIAAVLLEDAYNKLASAKRPCELDTQIRYLEITKKQLRLARYLNAKLNQP